MSADWATYTLGELGLIKTGKTPPSAIGNAFGGEIAFVTPSDMNGQKWITNTVRYLNKHGLDAVRSSLMPARSVAVSCIGSDMGKAALLSRPSVTNQQINTIAVDESKFNAEFVYYDLSVRQQELKNAASGSATPILNKGHFSAFEISVPPKDIQDKIAKILGGFDDKIALNRQINQTLEAMAQAIFKSWFVDFDPVKAKIAAIEAGQDPLRAAMSTISGKNNAELDAMPRQQYDELAATATLFPEELVDVPKGWKTQKIGDFIERISVGKKFNQKSALPEGSVPILDQGKSGIIGFHNEKPSVFASLNKPVVVFANHTCYMRLITFDFSAIQNVLPFIGGTVDTIWAYYATKDKIKFSEYKGHWPDFVLIETVVPTLDLTIHFRKVIEPLVFQMRSLEQQSEQLAVLRDTLLPKLLSGELSVAELEEVV